MASAGSVIFVGAGGRVRLRDGGVPPRPGRWRFVRCHNDLCAAIKMSSRPNDIHVTDRQCDRGLTSK